MDLIGRVLPTVLDVTVETPDYAQLTLKGISTDRILDVRKLLAVHVETCHLTNYSLAHEVRGASLKETVEIASLKPCHLTIVEEEYTEELAAAHVRRLLDIVASTAAFGAAPAKSPASSDAAAPSPPHSPRRRPTQLPELRRSPPPPPPRRRRRGEATRTSPCTLRRSWGSSTSSSPSPTSPLPSIVRVCNGKPVTIVASRSGFYPAGKRALLSHSLVGLLQQISRSFDGAYKALMKAFVEHNKFGNLPYGFRANTWLVPPIVADSPSIFPLFPLRTKLGVEVAEVREETGSMT
uniref:Clustered mitochondria protein N-terminal domain-containing protein n=1 Tax=Ananas comosus var. bracteatus TaxID=296719 RepID=A0A6V7PAF3_ANACO|nr:unnamed protein product [Ananas comosus var. bracteatus]